MKITFPAGDPVFLALVLDLKSIRGSKPIRSPSEGLRPDPSIPVTNLENLCTNGSRRGMVEMPVSRRSPVAEKSGIEVHGLVPRVFFFGQNRNGKAPRRERTFTAVAASVHGHARSRSSSSAIPRPGAGSGRCSGQRCGKAIFQILGCSLGPVGRRRDLRRRSVGSLSARGVGGAIVPELLTEHHRRCGAERFSKPRRSLRRARRRTWPTPKRCGP